MNQPQSQPSPSVQVKTAGPLAGGVGITLGALVTVLPIFGVMSSTSSGANPFSEGDSSSGGSFIWLMIFTVPIGVAILAFSIRFAVSAKQLDAKRTAQVNSGQVSIAEIKASMKGARGKAQRWMIIAFGTLMILALAAVVENQTVGVPQGYDPTLQGIAEIWSLFVMATSGVALASLLNFLKNLPIGGAS